VWVIDAEDDTLRQIDPDERKVEGEPLRLPGKPRSLAVGEGAVWVAVEDPDALLRIEPESPRVVATVRLPFAPGAVAAGDGAVWTGGDARLARVDPATNRLDGDPASVEGDVGSIALGAEAVWVALPDEKKLAEVNPSSRRVRRTIPVPTGAEEVAVGREGIVWIAGGGEEGSATLSPGAREVEASEEEGMVDVEADSEGDVWNLTGTFERRDTGDSSRTSDVRGIGRWDGGTDRGLGRGEVVPEEVTHLAVGEGAVWLIHAEYGPDEIGAIRRVSLKPRDELEPQE
jgi:hypothetical protein